MKKAIFAIIILLTTTAVFGQKKRPEDPGWKAIQGDTLKSFTVWENGKKKHYSAVQTEFKPGKYFYSVNNPDDMRELDSILNKRHPEKKKPVTKKPVTKPTTRNTKIDTAGDVYIGEVNTPGYGYTKEKAIEIIYDFSGPGHGYKDTEIFPLQIATIDHKFKCDTVRIHDTIRIKDTVPVPVFLVDVTDTVPANTIMYKKDSKSDRVYTTSGFALIRGLKTMVQGRPQWADKPQLVGALDNKKRAIKNVIQIL